MSKVLMPIGDAAEVLDTFYPYFRLPEDDFDVIVAGPERRTYALVLHEKPAGWDITEEKPGYHLAATAAFKDVDPAEYAGLFLTGGRAPEYLRYDEDLLGIVRHFFKANKPVACVCHGVEILTAAGVIKGRILTTVAKCELDVLQGGAKYVDKPVAVDGNLVSARTWHDNTPLLKEFIRLLRTPPAR